MGPQPLDYFGRRNTNTTVETAIIADAEVDSVELQWQRDSGRSWLVLHEEVRLLVFKDFFYCYLVFRERGQRDKSSKINQYLKKTRSLNSVISLLYIWQTLAS